MRRFHLIEIADQPWCPAAVRDALTGYLQFVLHLTQPYHPLLPRLRQALVQTGASQIVDLCSGAGGPWLQFSTELAGAEGTRLAICLTDRYPNLPAFRRLQAVSAGRITFRPEPLDARAVPQDLVGFRTLFASLHHFPPHDARRILADAVQRGEGIAVVEATQRSRRALLLMALLPLAILLVTPFIRPLRWARLFWTYLVPVVPLVALMDGVVSCLRTYTPAELHQLIAGLGVETYHWEIGTEAVRGTPIPITYLIGYPLERRL
jgi:hypothetical protein